MQKDVKFKFDEILFSKLNRLYIEKRTLIKNEFEPIKSLNELVLPNLELHKDNRLCLLNVKLKKLFFNHYLILKTPRNDLVFSKRKIKFNSKAKLEHIETFLSNIFTAITFIDYQIICC